MGNLFIFSLSHNSDHFLSQLQVCIPQFWESWLTVLTFFLKILTFLT